MEFHVLSMEFHSIPWNSIQFYGIPWNSMESHGIPWGYFTRVGSYIPFWIVQARCGQNRNYKICPQVSFFSVCCNFYGPVVFFHAYYTILFLFSLLLIIFSNMNCLVKFFVGCTSYFLLALRIIFHWYCELLRKGEKLFRFFL